MYNMICAHSVAQIVRCAALFSFADHLAAGPATAEAVARVEGLDADATFRLMRACAAYGLMGYDKDRGFSATPLLATLRTDDPRSLCAMAMVQAGHGHWAAWGRLDEVIRTGRPQTEVALGSSLWAYFATAAGAREGQAFSQAMGGITGMLMRDAARLIDTGPVEFALDVGGASGALIHALMKQNPGLRGAVLDLPENSAEAAKAAEALGLQERLSIISGDFFVKVPAADLYLLKHILHDWKDAECGSILRDCRGAIKPAGRSADAGGGGIRGAHAGGVQDPACDGGLTVHQLYPDRHALLADRGGRCLSKDARVDGPELPMPAGGHCHVNC